MRAIADPEEGLIVDKRIFHTFERKGLTFKARSSSEGPYVTTYRGHDQLGNVTIGAGVIGFLPHSEGDFEPGWTIRKYDFDEPRIALPRFTADDAADLAAEFPIKTSNRKLDRIGRAHFKTSPSGKSFQNWIRRRPEIAKEDGVLPSPDADSAGL